MKYYAIIFREELRRHYARKHYYYIIWAEEIDFRLMYRGGVSPYATIKYWWGNIAVNISS